MKMNCKTVFSMAMLLCMLMVSATAFSGALAEGEEWICPNCGSTVSGNFCSSCGEKKPMDGTWTCPSCGQKNTGNFCSNCGTKSGAVISTSEIVAENTDTIRLDLNIAFEKNAYFSTYDVKLFVDDEWITTLRHGIDYQGTVYVTPGKHIVLFKEDSSSYPADGSTLINISEPSLYSCEIHATMSAVQITGERTETISANRAAPEQKSAIRVDGDIQLQVNIEFRKNGIFSQYDVDMYLDDTYIDTLPHGKNFDGTLLVSAGKHMITFYRSGRKSIRGSCSFKVEKNATFSCKIEAENNKVDITKDKLTY